MSAGQKLNHDGDFDIFVEDPWFFRDATDEYSEPGKSVVIIRYSPLYDVAPISQIYCFVLVCSNEYTPRNLPLAGYAGANLGDWLDNNCPGRRNSKPVPVSNPRGGPKRTKKWNDPKWRMRGITNKHKFCYPVNHKSVLYWEDEDRWFTEAEYFALLGESETFRELCNFPSQRTLDRIEYLVLTPTLQGTKTAPGEAPGGPWRIDLASRIAPQEPSLGLWWTRTPGTLPLDLGQDPARRQPQRGPR